MRSTTRLTSLAKSEQKVNVRVIEGARLQTGSYGGLGGPNKTLSALMFYMEYQESKLLLILLDLP